jgi:hypothetical protein
MILCSVMWKVKLNLCRNDAMNTYGGVEVKLHVFLTSSLDGRSALHSGCSTPGSSLCPTSIWDQDCECLEL